MKNNLIHRLALPTVLLAVATTLSLPAMGESSPNRRTSDGIFNEPRGSGWNQILFTLGDLIAFQVIRPKLPEASAITEADQKILASIHSDVSDEMKLRSIHDAETDLARARLAALNSLQEKGILPRVVRSARIIGSSLFLVDIFGRAWVWQALNANPTWSPTVTVLRSLGNDLSTDRALRDR